MSHTHKANLFASTLFAGIAGFGMPLAAAVLFALPSNAAAQTQPQAQAQTQAQAPAQTQTAPDADDSGEVVVVTGSILPRNANSTSPLGVLSADDLQQRGQTTIADTVQTLSGNNAGMLPNSFSANGAFAAGAAGASLRGLTTNSTLVLVDGLRPAYYPLADDAIRNFVDLNTIPQSIVERIEVLKDGASSTYGADAIAGVINIITRHSFEGFQASAEHGLAEHGGAGENHVSAIWGHGDVDRDGYNFYLAAEWQRDDVLFNRDRGFPFNTNDLSSWCNSAGTDCGVNGVVNGVQFDNSFIGVGSSNNALVIRTAPGNPTTPFGDYQLLNSNCGPNQTAATITPGQATAGGVGGFSAPVNVCQLDLVHQYGTISPEDNRFSVTGRMSFRVGDADAYLMANYYQNDVSFIGIPSNIRQRTTPASTGVTVSTANVYLPVYVCPAGSLTHECTSLDVGATLNPDNPFAGEGNNANIFYRFGDIPATTDTFSQTFRGAGGITGDATLSGHEFHYSVDFSAMQTNLDLNAAGNLYYPNLITAINQGTYNFTHPELNSQAIRDFVAPDSIQHSNSRLVQAQANVSTDVFDLPGGAAQLGLLLSERYEELDNPSANDDANGPLNRYFTINPFGASGERHVESGAFELDMPFTSMIDVNLSGRYDSYSTGQTHFSPKIGVRFNPFDWLGFRSTWSEGFRIPSFAESFAVPSTGFILVQPDPTWCAANHASDAYCVAYGLGLTTVSDPGLQPETSTNFNIGVVLQPFHNWSFSADYYRIEKNDVIAGANYQAAVDAYYAGAPIPAGFTIVGDLPDPALPGAPLRVGFVRYSLQNLNEQITDGWDFNLTGSHELFNGIQWTTTAEATYVNRLDQSFPDAPTQHYAGTIGPFAITSASGTPQWRFNWQNTFESGPVTMSLTAYWTEGYLSVAEDAGAPPHDKHCASQSPTATYLNGGTIICRVDDSFFMDLHAQYELNDHWQVYMDVANILDDGPALDPTTYGGFNYNPAWGTPGIIGRFFTFGVRANF